MDRTLFHIGELARRCGLNPRTIRYYEARGLLPPPQRTSAGYRVYTETDLERLRFIRKAKRLGLTLEEIREILVLRDRGMRPCPRVKSLLRRKIAVIEERLRDLEALKKELTWLQREAETLSSESAVFCGIIEHPLTRA